MTISGGIRKYSYLFMSWRICGFINSSPCFLTFVHVRYKVLHTIRNEIIILAESFLSKTNELHIIFCLLVPEPYTYYVIELFSLLRSTYLYCTPKIFSSFVIEGKNQDLLNKVSKRYVCECVCCVFIVLYLFPFFSF